MQNYFQLDDSIVYLNHAAVAPWPVATATAIKNFADENSQRGAQHYPRWMVIEAELREKLKQLINADSVADIALLKSTSEGLSFIAHGLSWSAGDNIVIPAEEFPSNRIVWQSLQHLGVEIRPVPITESANPEQDLIHAIDKNTRLLSCSSVQFARGLRLDLEPIGHACRQQQVLFCVDAIQSLGVFAFDVEAVQADFVVADGHKWMLGPEGLALFYCRDSAREQLQLHEFGWHMVENAHDFEQSDWSPAATAVRFECGSPNSLGTIGLNASLGVLLEVGIAQVTAQVLGNTEQLTKALQNMKNVRLLSPQTPSRQSGIVTFSKEDVETDAMYKYLMQSGVICAPRGGGLRLSPHFYTSAEKIDRALQLIHAYAA